MKSRYIVVGRGEFPTDMLRYDQAKIISSFTLPDWPGRTFYFIEGARAPTHGRWQSFLWSVLDQPVHLARFGIFGDDVDG